jgi:tRNA A37 threonylcarbamoyladenosine synthetase subunit TsaC/SUA5/YrdC
MHEVQRKIIDSVGPMVFTSPNIHSQEVLTDSELIRRIFGHEGEIYYIPEELIQGELKPIGDEFASTMVDTLTKPPKIIRQGVINIPFAQLKK